MEGCYRYTDREKETGYVCEVRETGKSILKTRMIDLCQVIVEVLS